MNDQVSQEILLFGKHSIKEPIMMRPQVGNNFGYQRFDHKWEDLFAEFSKLFDVFFLFFLVA